MKISADDWHFRPSETDTLVLDVFLSNAQHALLEVYPMRNPSAPNGQIPEMVIFCEFPGEKLTDAAHCTARWITRPPDRTCPWSNVQISPALMQQIGQKLGYISLPQTVVAA